MNGVHRSQERYEDAEGKKKRGKAGMKQGGQRECLPGSCPGGGRDAGPWTVLKAVT